MLANTGLPPAALVEPSGWLGQGCQSSVPMQCREASRYTLSISQQSRLKARVDPVRGYVFGLVLHEDGAGVILLLEKKYMQDVMYLQYSALRYGCLHRWIGSALNTTLGFVSANATADSSIKALLICREEGGWGGRK